MSGSGQPGSPLDVPAGLFVLRYQSGPPGAVAPPAVVVTVPEICAPHIDLIAATSGSDFVLDRPGACLVVRARKIATLNLTAQSPAGDGRLDAVLRLERLGHAYPTDNAVVEKDTSEDAPAFGVLAHLAHRGDVRVGAGEWVGGPDAPFPIEGLQIASTDQIECQLKVGSPAAEWGAWVQAGGFVGTRRRALSVFGIRLRLGHAAAERSLLDVSALFLTKPVVRSTGPSFEATSTNMREPLVGLSLNLIDKLSAASDMHAKRRVRVFRSTH